MEGNQNPEKRYRQVKASIPEHIAVQIDKKIGGNSINALVKLFLLSFAKGKAGFNIEFEVSPEEFKKVT